MDLISIETVCRLRERGISLQKIRKMRQVLDEIQPGLHYHFARESIWTDGSNTWFQINNYAKEIIGKNPQHTVFLNAIKTFAAEIEYKDDLASA